MFPNSPKVRMIDVLVPLHHNTWHHCGLHLLVARYTHPDQSMYLFRVTVQSRGKKRVIALSMTICYLSVLSMSHMKIRVHYVQ